MEAKIEETIEDSQLREAADPKISFEKVATLSMAVLNFVQGTKNQYWDHANIVAGLVDGVVPEEMERFLTKSADSLRKRAYVETNGVPTDLVDNDRDSAGTFRSTTNEGYECDRGNGKLGYKFRLPRRKGTHRRPY